MTGSAMSVQQRRGTVSLLSAQVSKRQKKIVTSFGRGAQSNPFEWRRLDWTLLAVLKDGVNGRT